MLGAGGGQNNIQTQQKKQNSDEASQIQENDLDDEIPF